MSSILDLIKQIDPNFQEKWDRATNPDTNIFAQLASDFADQMLSGSNNENAPNKTPVGNAEQSLNTALLALATSNSSDPLPNISAPTPVQPELKIPGKMNSESKMTSAEFEAYKNKLQLAYPDQKIDLSFDPKSGLITGGANRDFSTINNPAFATPGFQSGVSISAFDKIKSDIEAAQAAGDNKQVLNLAFNLNRIAADQQASNYNKFLQQANEANGIPDLEAAIAQIRKGESLDPNNPRDGRRCCSSTYVSHWKRNIKRFSRLESITRRCWSCLL